MATSFRARVFRQLLLFAVVPAVLFTVLGYYLTVESPLRLRSVEPADVSRLTEYHHQELFDMLDRDVRAFAKYQDTSRVLSDFIMRVSGDSLTIVASRVGLPSTTARTIAEIVNQRPRGLVDCNGRIVQYSAWPPDKPAFVGGVLHSAEYMSLVEQMQRQSASQSAHLSARSAYITFVGGLFVVVAIMAILIAYLLSSRISRNLSGPLVSLSDASQRIAAGDFRQSVPPEGAREIRTLIDNFNKMAVALDSTTSQLAQAERVAAWRQVARRFAHELKNPLQPILVSLYRIEKQLEASGDYEKVKEPLRAASEEVKHLTSLAERFSHLAKLPAPTLEEVNLIDTVNEVKELYREKLASLTFETDISAEATTILADKTYLREVLHNLIQNAVDACRSGDRIAVSAQCETGTVRISVADTGTGMDVDTLAAARLPYYTTKSHGTGLGLAIVERAVNEMHGRLDIQSQLNSGTTIIISLPQERSDAG